MGVEAYVGLAIHRHLVHENVAVARSNRALRDVSVFGHDAIPDGPGDLVPAIDRLTGVAAEWFEEIGLPLRPESVGNGCRQADGRRDRDESAEIFGGEPDSGHGLRVRQENEIALVGEEGMRAWRRGDDDVSRQIRLAQWPMFRSSQIEVDEAVVDEIDRATLHRQFPFPVNEVARIDDPAFDAVALEERPGELELDMKRLLERGVVDDGDRPQRFGRSLASPFALEHGHETAASNSESEGWAIVGATTGQHCVCDVAAKVQRKAPPALVLISMRRGPCGVR